MASADQPDAHEPSIARREHILDAATSVFAEKGFHRATIREVARTAGVADGTIYNYFENKAALLLGLLERLNESERREPDFARGAAGDAGDFMQGYIAQRFATIEQSGFDIFQMLISELLIDRALRERYRDQTLAPTFAIAEAYLQGGMVGGALRPFDPQLASRALAGMTLGVLLLRLLGDKTLQERWTEMPEVIASILTHGLMPQGQLSESERGRTDDTTE
ncbi:MAG TPA: helix-turn-helix domain-containing protein [Thermomicrobiales bacterium]